MNSARFQTFNPMVKPLLLICLLLMASGCFAQKKGWSQKGSLVERPSDKTSKKGIVAKDLQVALNLDKIKSCPLVTQFYGDEFPSIVVYSRDGEMYVYNHDGTQRDNFPKKLGFFGTSTSSPSAGDVDGDGKNEIVVLGVGPDKITLQMIVISPDDNTSLTVQVSGSAPYDYTVQYDNPHIEVPYGFNASPCIINCNVDNAAEEILIRDGKGRINVLSYNGTGPNYFTNYLFENGNLSDFQTAGQLESDRDSGGFQIHSPSMSVINYDMPVSGGGTTPGFQIICPSTDGKVYGKFVERDNFVDSLNGAFGALTPPAGTLPQKTQFFASGALADIDHNGSIDLVTASTDGRLFLWDANGPDGIASGWPKQVGQAIISTPIMVDLDTATSDLEILVGCNDDHIYAFHKDGTPVSGWPVATKGDVFGGVVAGELDGQPGLEIVATALDGQIYVWHADGSLMTGWPKRVETPLYGSPALADLHNSGRMSIICGGFDGRVFVFDLSPISLNTNQGWLQFGGTERRQGHP